MWDKKNDCHSKICFVICIGSFLSKQNNRTLKKIRKTKQYCSYFISIICLKKSENNNSTSTLKISK